MPTLRHRITQDFTASLLVFLVALPLCLGIAIASGVPPAKGILTGIIGGLLAGALAGSPFSVSGPAAGLTVLVFGIVSHQGLALLGPVTLLAGMLQIAGGLTRLGGWVRAIPIAVVEGMLAAIGLMLAAGQAHVMLDRTPHPSFAANIAALEPALAGGNRAALGLALLTMGAVLLWERVRPPSLKAVPAKVLAVAAATIIASLAKLDVARIVLPPSLLDAVSWPDPQGLRGLAHPDVLLSAASLALIASVESLLSAAAVQRMRDGLRIDYDRELIAQGIGNAACGLVGALPMTGVIVRSAVNIRAGARSRLSTVLHGIWLLALVVLAAGALRLVPTASLASVLVLIGVRLVNVGEIRALARHGWTAIGIYLATVACILAFGILPGVLAGLALSLALRRLAGESAKSLFPGPKERPPPPLIEDALGTDP